MGYLRYGESRIHIIFDDRVLSHLQVVIVSKLRRKEGFFFSWIDDPSIGNGRSSIWMSCEIPLNFHWNDPAQIKLNREWLEELSRSANSAQGLFLSGEPDQPVTRPLTNVIGVPKHMNDYQSQTAPARRRRAPEKTP